MAASVIGFIGGGSMGEALARGILRARLVPAGQVLLSEPDLARRGRLVRELRVRPAAGNADLAGRARLVVLAVKPQQVSQVCAEIAPALGRATVVVSIAAGVPLAALAQQLKVGRLVRAMPNTPALIGAGIAGLYALPGVSAAERKQAEAILGAVGATVWIEDEGLMDAVTAVSGSGPAYVFWFIEQLANAGASLGLPSEVAHKLALETVLGAAKLAAQSADSPAALRERVTSKGGTTEAALKAFEEQKLAERFLRAVEAARDRGDELGGQMAKD
jgi:pyrroline-5-carboxylate reductase